MLDAFRVECIGIWFLGIGTTLGTWLFKLGTYLVFGKAFTPLNYASSAVILRQRYSVDRFTPVTPECSVGSQLISTADDSSASAVIAEQTEEDPILLEKTLLILNPDRIPVPHAEPAPGFQLLLPPTHKPSPESGDEIPK